MAQATHHQCEGGQPQVGLGFATAGGEEDQINVVALAFGVELGIIGAGDAHEIHQQKSQLEGPPGRSAQ